MINNQERKLKQLTLSTAIKDLFMVGPAYTKRLAKLNIVKVEDLLHHYPFRYDDYRLISKINQAQEGEVVTIIGKIISFENIYTKSGKKIQKMIIADETGQLPVIFFNQPFLKKTLKPGLTLSLSGKLETYNHKLTFISPEHELLKEKKANNLSSTIHTARLVPIYPETAGVSSKWLRSRIYPLLNYLLPKIDDWLPDEIKNEFKLEDLKTALKQIHFPQDQKEIKKAKERLAFNEIFLLQLETLIRQKIWRQKKVSQALKVENKTLNQFFQKLPFKLTDDQHKVITEILQDLSKNQPMNRLLQGDVGCGKTVVAAVATYVAYLNGCQTIFMAPTEILALQHYQTFKKLLEPWGVKVALITSATKPKNKLKNQPLLKEPKTDVFIGTHALLYQRPDLNNLALVIIDEQHRFGVEQRSQLLQAKITPHVLTMTATPIPRTVALTLYGDLDLSVIRQMPAGRQQVKTWVVPPEKRMAAYSWIKKQIETTHCQAFIVCPLIEPSEKDSMQNIKAAKSEFENLKKQIFPDLKLGLLHGRMSAKEKEKVIEDFRLKKTQILVATPVVEVGIDIPNATIILIEGAERFGLATLHQLRGRVGRSNKQAYCLLFSSQKGKGYQRLKLMETTHNGLWLAEMDLKWRGPGELYGTAQHGFIKFKLANFSDFELIHKSQLAAKKILNQLKNYPLLKAKLKKDTIKPIEPN